MNEVKAFFIGLISGLVVAVLSWAGAKILAYRSRVHADSAKHDDSSEIASGVSERIERGASGLADAQGAVEDTIRILDEVKKRAGV